jgi:hypothetical protein
MAGYARQRVFLFMLQSKKERKRGSMVCTCGHSGVVHHLNDQCSLCLEDSKGENGCYNYQERPPADYMMQNVYICDKCNETWPEYCDGAPGCGKCKNEHMRLENVKRLLESR